MLTIKGKDNTVTKTLRLTEHIATELERIAKENNATFTSVVEQCLQYALDSMGSDEKDVEKA